MLPRPDRHPLCRRADPRCTRSRFSPEKSLTPPFLGDARVVLTVGSASKRYCASFGGTTIKNDTIQLKRKDAAPPTMCVTSTTTGPTSTTPGFCGDGVCFTFFGETCSNCPADCAPCGPCDMNATCDRAAGENCGGCYQDCGFCACDTDDVCEPLAGEHCGLCGDCSPCNRCGDGVCAGGETCGDCPADCCPS